MPRHSGPTSAAHLRTVRNLKIVQQSAIYRYVCANTGPRLQLEGPAGQVIRFRCCSERQRQSDHRRESVRQSRFLGVGQITLIQWTALRFGDDRGAACHGSYML